MDVQTLAPAAAQGLPADSSGGSFSQGSDAQAVSVQPLTIPQPGSDRSADPSRKATPLHLPQEVARVFSGGSSSHITVSFQVEHSPNEIVTVFKNSDTGEIITQVPSEIMIKMAEFFDQVAGVVLDKSA